LEILNKKTVMLSKLLTIIGITLIATSLYMYYQKEAVSPVTIGQILPEAASTQHLEETPVLRIRDASIFANIYKAETINGEWKTDARGVSMDNNVIYGHNWKSILGNLMTVKPGMIVEIVNPDSSVQKYKIATTQEIEPNKTEVVNNNPQSTLVIYTCSGTLDSKRFVVLATKIT